MGIHCTLLSTFLNIWKFSKQNLGEGETVSISFPFLLLSFETTQEGFQCHYSPVPTQGTHDPHVAKCTGHSPTLLLDLLAVFDSLLLPTFSAPPSAQFLECNSIFMIYHWLLSLSLFESYLPNSYRVVSLGHFFLFIFLCWVHPVMWLQIILL